MYRRRGPQVSSHGLRTSKNTRVAPSVRSDQPSVKVNERYPGKRAEIKWPRFCATYLVFEQNRLSFFAGPPQVNGSFWPFDGFGPSPRSSAVTCTGALSEDQAGDDVYFHVSQTRRVWDWHRTIRPGVVKEGSMYRHI